MSVPPREPNFANTSTTTLISAMGLAKNGRRTVTLGLLGIALVPLTGCTTRPLQPVKADGTYCYSIGRRPRNKLFCTPERVPSLAVEADVKRFEASGDALTLYVVRKRWGDTSKLAVVSFDERTRVTTIPESLIRIRLRPGEHRLAVAWDGRSTERVFSGAAGEVRFVELVGWFWTWGGEYHWEEGSPEGSRSRALSSKLIADLDLRR